ncbi:hypothetical protein ACFOWE_26660 [Planomonospora corallina]|uniref:Uncharacterized protein n=1 Tax=Planomonospora corallina TaxID=1806052 RepID=A0ABV8IG37_9ACTN
MRAESTVRPPMGPEASGPAALDWIIVAVAASAAVTVSATVRSWGRRVPRWLPLAPALIGAATLAPYGAIGLVYAALGTFGAVTVPRGDFPTPGDALLVTWIGLGAFAVYGVALAVAAWSCLRRTRPVCAPLGAGVPA